MNTHEEWRAIPGWEGLYSVSDLGRVRSERRVVSDGRTCRSYVLKLHRMKSGHLSIGLWRNNKGYGQYVHRLVLSAFVGPCPDGMETLHRNGIPWDNTLSNLHYGTHCENIHDSVRHGVMPRGETHGARKLSDDAVRAILASNEKHGVLGKMFGVSVTAIWKVKNGKRWRHISCPTN